MSQVYTIIAIVGFTLAALFLIATVTMFFRRDIRQVRNDLTGKTAARSIAEIRTRATSKKRTTSDVAKRLGWEHEISSEELADFSADDQKNDLDKQGRRDADASRRVAGGPFGYKVSEDEYATTVLEDAEGEAVTTVLTEESPEEETEGATTLLTEQVSESSEAQAVEDCARKTSLSAREVKNGLLSIVVMLICAFSLSAPPIDARALEDGTPSPTQGQRIADLADPTETIPPASPIAIADEGVLPKLGKGVATPYATTIKVGIRVGIGDLNIPYGVDVEEWINAQDIFTNSLGLSHSGLLDRFVGRKALVLSSPSAYPQPGDTLTFSWGTSVDMSWVIDGSAPDLVTLSGLVHMKQGASWLLDGISVRGMSADQTRMRLTGARDPGVETRLWMQDSRYLDTLAGSPVTFTFVQGSVGDMTFPTPGAFAGAGQSLQLPEPSNTNYPAIVYARADRSYTFNQGTPDAVRIEKGQIVKLPRICFDTASPGLDGALRIEGGLFYKQILYAAGVTVQSQGLDAVDPGMSLPQQADTTSGLAKAVLEYGGAALKEVTLGESGRGSNPAAFDFLLNDSGSYEVASLRIRFIDVAGNSQAVAFGNLSDAQGQPFPSGVSRIILSSTAPQVSLSYENTPVGGNPGYYYGRTATVAIDEGYDLTDIIERYTSLPEQEQQQIPPVLTFENTLLDPADPARYLPVTLALFEGTATGGTARISFAQDGVYRLVDDSVNGTLTYVGAASGKKAAWDPAADRGDFIIDRTVPVPGTVAIDPQTPIRWGWLFATGPTSVDLTVADVLSGIDPASVELKVGNDPEPFTYQDDGSGLAGTVTWSIPATDRSISLDEVSLLFSDKAGNANSIADLKAYANKNLAIEGIFVDGTAPIIAVAYDNDDARNGTYFNAPRTATITLTEASFSFVRTNDPESVVATQDLNGTKRPVKAKDFENLSGDGITWVTTVSCDADGVYCLEADFTDPSGKAAEPYRSGEFVIDMTAPRIMVDFDNNDVANGMYFKAPRKAVVTISEMNFAPDLASVDIAASGTVPGISGWTQSSAGVWTTEVWFAEELHYRMEVGCTDLAGNVAETAVEPEFVIDMTAPTVVIDRVADNMAYKDEVAPLVTFGDANFEPLFAETTIVGGARRNTAYFASSESATDTAKVIDYKDFEYALEVDDVYTLTAKVVDKAGNESQSAVMFSVNRFGSNYVLADSSKPLAGSFLKRGEDLVVIETNVSGLASSSACIAHNDVVNRLVQGQDYRVEAESGPTSWSRYIYTFPARLFTEDGYYRVMLTSLDRAGNLSESLMEGKNGDRTDTAEIEFAVDGTNPVATIGNITDDSAFLAPNRRIDLYANDNMQVEKIILNINGQEVEEHDAESLNGTGSFSYDLPATNTAQLIRLEVTDKAGNTTLATAENVVVTNDVLRYAIETPTILYPSIVAAVLIVGVAVGVGLRVRARRITYDG